MGYTRYWNRTDKPITESFVKKVKKIIKDSENAGIKIRDAYGEKPPVITLDEVSFNGDSTGATDLSHESCLFDNEHSGADFCKTARKPYDYTVRRVLETAEEEGLINGVYSDGENDEIISDDEYRFRERIFAIANKERVGSENLYRTYKQLMEKNLETELYDIIRENKDELRKDSIWQDIN